MTGLALLTLLAGCRGDPSKSPAGGDADADTSAPDPDTSADTAEGTGLDTADTAEPPCATATFLGLDGGVTDMTEIFTSGERTTILSPGTLTFCPGEWFVRLTVEADLSVVGLGEDQAETVLSAGQQGGVLRVEGPWSLSLANVTLDRGDTSAEGDNNGGAGIYAVGAAVALDRVTFSGHRGEEGAAIQGWDCQITGSNVEIVENVGRDEAGAVYLNGCSLALEDAIFADNACEEAAGALQLVSSPAEIRCAVFTRNEAGYYAGAVSVTYGALTLEDVAFADNLGDVQAGALHVSAAEAYLDAVSFAGNASEKGGGIFLYSDSYVGGTSCDFADNAPNDVEIFGVPGGMTLGAGGSFACEGGVCAEK